MNAPFDVGVNSRLEMPSAIANYLIETALQDRAAAYLQTTATGHLISSGGALKKYQLQAIARGDYIGEAFYYLEGFFPLVHTETMQHVQLACGPVVDVHIITHPEDDGAGWILLLDATAEAQRAQQLQQKGNDLSLLRQQYARLLHQNLAPSQAGQDAVSQLVQQQTVSVLIIKFCGPLASRLGIGKPAALKAVNASLSFIAQAIVEEGGLINHVMGGTVAAFFGLLPSQQPAQQQAIYAAKRAIKQLMEKSPSYALDPAVEAPPAASNQGDRKQSQRLGIGAGITSGEVAAGILPSQGGQRINAVGDPIQSAAQMGRYIQPGTITIDRKTFEAVGDRQREFQALSGGTISTEESPAEIMLYRLKFE